MNKVSHVCVKVVQNSTKINQVASREYDGACMPNKFRMLDKKIYKKLTAFMQIYMYLWAAAAKGSKAV